MPTSNLIEFLKMLFLCYIENVIFLKKKTKQKNRISFHNNDI